MKKLLRVLRFINPVYWVNVCCFGKFSADLGCSVFKSGIDNSAIQAHSISVAMGWTKKSQVEWIEEGRRCVSADGDFIRQ